MKHHYLLLLSCLALIGAAWAEDPASSDTKVGLRAPKAEFVAPPSAQPAAPEPAPTPSILPT
ncbi:MAG: hypothetical protein QM531_08815, partial [Candidatus Pacebacteria bacterium]|nr:hypothetical protein [Candidatus Paceibacterota bacterium]